MDFKKLFLYAILAIIAVTLWTDWTKEHPPAGVATVAVTKAKANNKRNFIPPTFNPAAQAHTTNQAVTPAKAKVIEKKAENLGKLITINTDLYKLKVSLKGGNLVDAYLLKYPVSLKDKNKPIQLLNTNVSHHYVTKSGLTNINRPGQTNADASVIYGSNQTSYTLKPGQKNLTVRLLGISPNGLKVLKTLSFNKNSYQIHITYKVKNTSPKSWSGSLYNQVTHIASSSSHGFLYMHTFSGAAISTPSKHFKKITYKDLGEQAISQNARGGWIAMIQHYFLTGFIPQKNTLNHYYSHEANMRFGKSLYSVGYVTPAVTLLPGKSDTFKTRLYLGPKIPSRLEHTAPFLKLSINYGWLSIISQFIFWVMNAIHKIVGNWGWSIVIVTVLIKLVFYKLSDTSFKSMAKMRELQPRIALLKQRFGDDKQAMSKATMEMYREEKINPLGGCLPMLVQIPVFIALYYVLFASVELRQAPFILWIHDLSAKDPYYILPILMGISMFLQQKLTPTPGDSTQAKMMMFLPVIFTVFFLNFPAGLVLYWLVNNCTQVAHQWYSMRGYAKKRAEQKARNR